jgi:4-hydroxybenzoyl-CoA thioesterase
MHFTLKQKVLFKHCDPAGIVFYPRYFEMINDAVEAMFADLLGWPFETMHPDHGVPTAHFDVSFKTPSRHGDRLDLDLSMTKLGGTSLGVQTHAHENGDTRFVSEQVLVCVNGAGQATRWPDAVRDRITNTMEASA